MVNKPPKLPLRLLRWFCDPDLLPSIEGDLKELYTEEARFTSRRRANQFLFREVLKLFRPGIIRKFEGHKQLNNYGMFKNHIKIALRNFRRDYSYTAINVLGLTLGLTCSLIIMLWVQDEFKHDRFHENGPQIYKVLRNATYAGGQMNTEFGTSYPIGDALVSETPEIIAMTRYSTQGDLAIKIGDQLVSKKLVATDPQFFEMFSFPLTHGTPETCISKPNQVVISEDIANNFFDGKDPIGEELSVLVEDMKFDFIITDVFVSLSPFSGLQFDMVVNIQNFLPFNPTYKSWGNSWLQTYVQLDKNASIGEVSKKVADIPKRVAGVDWFELNLQPFEDNYLYSKYKGGKPVGGRIDNVRLFVVIAIFTLLVACFNYVNLSVARSVRRFKEVGIKKVVGASKFQLISQFFLESGLLVFFSIFLAVLLGYLCLPSVNSFIGSNLNVNFLNENLYLVLGSVALFMTLISGIYPSLVISPLKPMNALKGKIIGKLRSKSVSNWLVTLQFTLTMALIAGAVVVHSQFSYINSKDLGYDGNDIILVDLDVETYKKRNEIMTQLKNHSAIQNVSGSNEYLVDGYMGRSGDPYWDGKTEKTSGWFSIFSVDFGLIEMIDLEIIEGRSFIQNLSTDTLNYIINEAALAKMSLQDPIGTPMGVWTEKKGKIIGVVKDFHFESLYHGVFPMIIRCKPSNTSSLYIKAKEGQTKEALTYMSELHEEVSPMSMNYHFLEEKVFEMYNKDVVIQKLVGIFSFITILISSLGLLGISSIVIEQRNKEVSIRKVLGARVANIIYLLFRRQVLLISIGVLLGIPITHYWVTQWLQGFAYRIEINWWIYFLPIGLIFGATILTISRLSFKATHTNPTKFLRDE